MQVPERLFENVNVLQTSKLWQHLTEANGLETVEPEGANNDEGDFI